ncbi:toxin [Pseudomonas viridiflava]|uniref:leucine-rich repeat domain-containing protein n=1 Tax=Pseudomonas viridiflava TaxID=33069 RepID=UPI00177E0BF9|nr:leucine-rich repeat domain-containing protein [Pseudomonas viridiflava]MBD8189723.1 toxin [Pseudomonas viridiflava]
MKKFAYNENIQSLEVSELFFADGLKHAQKKGYKRIRVLKDSSSSSNVLDLSPLSENDIIESLNISQDIILRKIDFSPLYVCTSLQELMTPYMHGAIDFSKIPQLRTLYLSSAKNELIDLNLIQVTDLLLAGIKDKNLNFITAPKLKTLRLSGGSLNSLQGLEKCENLRELDISHCSKISVMDTLRDLNLTKLSIEKCKELRDYSVLSGHPTLKELFISELDSLAFVTSMKAIEYLKFWDVKDGDLSPLLKSKSLKTVDFSPQKKHYTHSNDEINLLLKNATAR